jgi:hypothetical protein
MSDGTAVQLWLIVEGPHGGARVTGVSRKSPRRGQRRPVVVSTRALAQGHVWLLARKEVAEVVIAADALPGPLEDRRSKMGALAEQYEVIQVPIVDR